MHLSIYPMLTNIRSHVILLHLYEVESANQRCTSISIVSLSHEVG